MPKKVKRKPAPDIGAVTAVDKQFYELTIAELNRKLARFRALTEELEVKNDELQNNLKVLDEDRNDVIRYLKRIQQDKIEEIKNLNKRLLQSDEAQKNYALQSQELVKELKEEYKEMHKQLSSDIKMLNGKLNALEEFRQQKEELMKKTESQEKALAEQEIRHKREIYDIEKKFVIGKDRLKKNMESRLTELSTDFQNVTEIRIAATTHRVIRENIAINNELNTMLATHQRLYNENTNLKKLNQTLKLETQLHTEEKRKAVSKSSIQLKLISELTADRNDIRLKLERCQITDANAIHVGRELNSVKHEKEQLQLHVRILEQNLHASRCDRNCVKTELEYTKDELNRLSAILYESVMSIKVALRDGTTAKKTGIKAAKREALLHNLLVLMNKANDDKPRRPSLESVDSVSAIYEKGDLGFVPKPVVLRSKIPTRTHQETEMGSSFEELLAKYIPPVKTEKPYHKDEEDIEEAEEQHEPPAHEDVLFIPKEESKVSEVILPVFGDSSELESVSSSESSHIDVLPEEPTHRATQAQEKEETAEENPSKEREEFGIGSDQDSKPNEKEETKLTDKAQGSSYNTQTETSTEEFEVSVT